MATAIKHPVPDRLKPSLTLWRSWLSVRVSGCQKLQMIADVRPRTGFFIAVHIWQQWSWLK